MGQRLVIRILELLQRELSLRMKSPTFQKELSSRIRVPIITNPKLFTQSIDIFGKEIRN